MRNSINSKQQNQILRFSYNKQLDNDYKIYILNKEIKDGNKNEKRK